MRSVLGWCVALGFAMAGTSAQSAWYEAKSKHFIIDANEPPDELRTYAEKLERVDQAVRYIRGMKDPDLTDSGRVTIFVVPDIDSIEDLIGAKGIGGFYRTRLDGSFAFVPRTTNVLVQGMSGGTGSFNVGISPQEIFFHEYAHHLQLSDASVAIPTWASEGFAEFFATAEANKDGSVSIGKNPPYRRYQDHYSLPIEQMVGVTYGTTMDWDQIEALYARGWLLIHYLAMTDERKGQLSKYIAGIQQGMSALDSAKNAFGDLKQLDRDLNAYGGQHSFLGLTISPAVIPIGKIDVRPLAPAEAAIMRVRIRSKAGVDDKSAPGVAGQARGAARDYPNDPVVQSALAEAEYDAKNFAAADAAADRALAADLKNVHALIYKGRAQLELAKANPKSANWDGVRDWFLKANQIDTEDAEPLALFYQSFVDAGQQPTQNALDGLLYAVELAPRDQDLRLTAVRAMIVGNKLDDARDLFAPIAYEPHLDKDMRELAVKTMAAMAASDAKTAVSLLDQASALAKKKNKH